MATCQRLFHQFILKRNIRNVRVTFRSLNTVCKKTCPLKVKYMQLATSLPTKIKCISGCSRRFYCSGEEIRELDEHTFHKICEDTLHILMAYFEELGDQGCFHDDYDVEYSDGVLTIKLGGTHGTYVINKQSPNKQIWLSSPKSGPKRYDFTHNGTWIYRHDGIPLHQLLSTEISELTGQNISFLNPLHDSKAST